ncbi:MAG: RNA-binding protein [Euryarchaeota archaeon]|nr:RNA-binding protein [Euryarchaeota archaeon]
MTDVEKRLKKMALDPSLDITIRVGKSGLTESLISELDSQLRTRNLVKVKVNRGIADVSSLKDELWQKMAENTSSNIILKRGNIAVFHRK